MKTCSQCKQKLDQSMFWANKRSADKLMYACKTCQGVKSKAWLSANKEKRDTYQKEYDFLFRKRPTQRTKKPRYAIYGLSQAQNDEILKLQDDGKCAICLTLGPLCIDHDHKTGQVRGMLCRSCNVLLGNAKDDKAILNRAVLCLNCNYSSPNRRKV